jgi:uncharacterized protein YjbI with pentapeptide repeats
MANPEQLEYLQDSADDWNVYRREHAIMRPDLSGADLSAAQLPGADLGGASMANATLLQADLTEANLADVDLSRADLTGVAGLKRNERP